jgi:hypothetical protein
MTTLLSRAPGRLERPQDPPHDPAADRPDLPPDELRRLLAGERRQHEQRPVHVDPMYRRLC